LSRASGGTPEAEVSNPVVLADLRASPLSVDDALKVTVPIWKHQVFADGSDEWVGTQ
jgi:hypothetical protein